MVYAFTSCPKCGSNDVIKAGGKYSRSRGGVIQRWRCKRCGRNFQQNTKRQQDLTIEDLKEMEKRRKVLEGEKEQNSE